MERNTAQRRAIHRALEESGRPMGPNEIFDAAKVFAPGLGIATVYRAIKNLLEESVIAQVELPGEPPRYALAGKDHHHHFRCNSCNKVYDLQGCPDSFKQFLPKGFKLEGHEIYLFGLCTACAAI